MKFRPSLHSFLTRSAIAAVLTLPSAQAVDFYWDGLTGNWGTVGDWSTAADGLTNPAAIPNSTTTADLFFNITSRNTATSDISNGNAVRNANSLTFNTTGTTNMRAGGASTANSTLTIGAGGITMNAGTVVLGVTPSNYGTLTVALGADQTWTNNSANSLTMNGAVTGASRNFTKAGTGTVRLNGANTYSGTTTITGGNLQIGNYSGLTNTSSITVSGGGTLSLVQVGTGATTNSINKSLSLSGTLSTAGGNSTNLLTQTWAGTVTLTGNSLITNNGNSTLILANTVDLGANQLTFQTDRDGSRINGNIVGTGGSLVKTSIRNLVLSGTNSYSGTTTVTGGTLQFANQVSLYNNNPADWTAANLNVQSGATLAFNVGGTGQFTTGDITTLLTNLATSSGATNGMNAGSNFGFDTTNSGGFFTIADVITDSTGAGGGARGLVKLGSGTLVLTNANTFTGPTTISAGTLRLENAAALQNSSSVSISAGTLQFVNAPTFAPSALTLAGGTFSSDRVDAGDGLTHNLGDVLVTNTTQTFTRGSNVTGGAAAIQLGLVTNAAAADGTTTFNPTTANLIITGGYTGAVNGGTNTLALGGTAANNSITGNITLGTRTAINVTKTGASVWTLSGNNTGLAGTTTVDAGALIATTLNALPNNSAVTFNGGTIGARIGGAGWTTAEVDTLLATATKTAGQLGIDTSNGDLTQWTDFTTTNLGPLGLAKLGTGTLTLNSALNSYTGNTLISQGTLAMAVDHNLTGNLTFGFTNGNTSATGSLDLATSNVNATFGGLNVLSNSATANTITIGSGKTLQINGPLTVGATSGSTTTRLAASGLGTLSIGSSILPTNAGVAIGAGTGDNSGNNGTLDLSGLSTFYANLGTGTFRVGSPTNAGGSGGGAGSTAILAANSTIQATALTVGSPDGAGAFQSLRLGDGTNLLNVDTITVGTSGRSSASVVFNGANGSVTVRGLAGGTSRANLTMASTSFGTGTSIVGTFDTTDHNADLMFGTMNVGVRSGTSASGTGSATATLNFSQGSLDANDLLAGSVTSGASTGSATGNLNLSGGTAIFNSSTNPLRLGANTDESRTATGNLNISGTANVSVAANSGVSIVLGNATVSGGTATGVINLTGGTLTVSGDIVRGAATGTSNATITLDGGTLDMAGNDIGSGTDAVTVTAESGTLSNVATINGSGGLTKTGTGTLTLSGTNTYTGDTTVNGGTLAVTGNSIANSGKLVIDGGIVDLTNTETVNTLFFGATQQPSGTYSTSSVPPGATITTASFSGTGILTVTTGPAGYASWQAAQNGGAGTSQTIDQDHDNDGVSNGIEFFLGGNTDTTGFTPLPPVVKDPMTGILSITWQRHPNYPGFPGNYGTNFLVETSTTLTEPWTPETPLGTNVTISGNDVTYTFPAPYTGKSFARLKVTGP